MSEFTERPAPGTKVEYLGHIFTVCDPAVSPDGGGTLHRYAFAASRAEDDDYNASIVHLHWGDRDVHRVEPGDWPPVVGDVWEDNDGTRYVTRAHTRLPGKVVLTTGHHSYYVDMPYGQPALPEDFTLVLKAKDRFDD